MNNLSFFQEILNKTTKKIISDDEEDEFKVEDEVKEKSSDSESGNLFCMIIISRWFMYS